MTPFGMRMRDLRAARGLTQQQQAEQLGVSTACLLYTSDAADDP